jgi:hypothetical protein
MLVHNAIKTSMKKPVVVWVAQAAVLLSGINYGLLALASLLALSRSKYSLAQGSGGFVIGSLVLSFAVIVFLRMLHRKITRRSVVLFLWAVLFIFPLSNGMRIAGYFPPLSPIPHHQLLGAAVYDVTRYVVLLALIIWLSFTKSAATYISASVRQSLQAVSGLGR